MFNVSILNQRTNPAQNDIHDHADFETAAPSQKDESSQSLTPSRDAHLSASSSLYVNDDRADHAPARTVAPHQNGLSVQEVRWFGEGVDIFQRRRQACLHIVVESHDDVSNTRSRIDDVKRRIATYQRRAGMSRVLWLEVLEARCSDHAHIIAPFPDRAAARWFKEALEGSPVLGARVHVEHVRDWKWIGYLLKEVTPQAWFASGRRFTLTKGPHSLIAGGDRVRVSRALEDMIIRRGQLRPRRRTYARRQARGGPADTARSPDLQAPEDKG